ncbi:MAG TPA: T9SS type A sorting domain-containing protein [Flavipsychrobacter sp.]|nr:T9SS type A sorting domain-containing protein [Flavipsychrobacter sp.]
MKTIVLSILLATFSVTSFAQSIWGINFDTPLFQDRIVRDTLSNPDCIWQVGKPTKTVFTSAHSAPNAIVTDTSSSVPASDTSIFYLLHVREQLLPSHIFSLHFWYQMDGDSTDFGMIEISPDTGHTWVNVLTEDTTYQMYWISPKPTLTGSTVGWQPFDLYMGGWASNAGGGPFPVLMTADTILFRFTYVTDSGSLPHDGWIIDDFHLEDWFESIHEVRNDNLITVSPNPASDVLKIHRLKVGDRQQIQIVNYTGEIIYNNPNFVGEIVDISQLPNGVYLLKYSDTKNVSVKSFIVQHE